LFITNKQSKALIGTLEDEVIDEETDGWIIIAQHIANL
jgi:hypothetical protein